MSGSNGVLWIRLDKTWRFCNVNVINPIWSKILCLYNHNMVSRSNQCSILAIFFVYLYSIRAAQTMNMRPNKFKVFIMEVRWQYHINSRYSPWEVMKDNDQLFLWKQKGGLSAHWQLAQGCIHIQQLHKPFIRKNIYFYYLASSFQLAYYHFKHSHSLYTLIRYTFSESLYSSWTLVGA